MSQAETLGLYIHIPFCQRKCPYCDFNSYANGDALFATFTAALAQEIRQAGAANNRPQVDTIFLGGGTPTVLPTAMLAEILAACQQAFVLAPDAEITSEANPGTVDQERFLGLRALGVNRLSMGVQSFDPQELRFLGRIHDDEDAERAFHAARAAGFDAINLDLIYGLPAQQPQIWQSTLDRAIALGPEHLSLYALTIEEGTPFAQWAAAGQFPYPDDDLAADLYELADERLSAAGYIQYEISNWARHDSTPLKATATPRFACRHNLIYWRRQPYLGCGPGAHSARYTPLPSRRWWNLDSPQGYVERMGSGQPVEEGHEAIDRRLGMGETMMLGLRLVREGVADTTFTAQWGVTLRMAFGEELSALERAGLIEWRDDHVRLTPAARLIGNRVFAEFLP